jgi:hypothetical protein
MVFSVDRWDALPHRAGCTIPKRSVAMILEDQQTLPEETGEGWQKEERELERQGIEKRPMSVDLKGFKLSA